MSLGFVNNVTSLKERTLAVGYPAASNIIGPYWRAEDLIDPTGTAIATLPSHIETEPYPLVQATPANQAILTYPYAAANNKKVLTFGGTKHMEAVGFQVQPPCDLWVLLQRIAFVSGAFFLEFGNVTLNAYSQDQATTNFRWVIGGFSKDFTVPTAGPASALIGFRIQNGGTGANASSITMNNGVPQVGTMGSSSLASRLIVGAKIGGASNYANMAFVEGFFKRGVPSAQEVTRDWTYWKNHFGLVIA